MNATQVATVARDHFERVHGPYSVLGFQTISVHCANGIWKVSCSLYPSGGARGPLYYEVAINNIDGIVLWVEKMLSPAERERNDLTKSRFGGMKRDTTIEDLKDKNIDERKKLYDFYEKELSARKEDSVVLDKIATVIDGFRARKGDSMMDLWRDMSKINSIVGERNTVRGNDAITQHR